MQVKERDDDLAELAEAMKLLEEGKREASAQADENMRLVNSLERQVSANEATEAALTRRIEELQAEIDDDE